MSEEVNEKLDNEYMDILSEEELNQILELNYLLEENQSLILKIQNKGEQNESI